MSHNLSAISILHQPGGSSALVLWRFVRETERIPFQFAANTEVASDVTLDVGVDVVRSA